MKLQYKRGCLARTHINLDLEKIDIIKLGTGVVDGTIIHEECWMLLYQPVVGVTCKYECKHIGALVLVRVVYNIFSRPQNELSSSNFLCLRQLSEKYCHIFPYYIRNIVDPCFDHAKCYRVPLLKLPLWQFSMEKRCEELT